MSAMTARRRPRKTVTLDPDTIGYVDDYATAHGGLEFSRALEAIIREHAGGLSAAVLAAAVGSTDPAAHASQLPSIVRTSSQWTD